jgi:hypothetical protein
LSVSGRVVADHPELGEHLDVHRRQHDSPAGDAQHLTETLLDVLPVLQREHGHCGFDRLIWKG